MLYSFYEWGVNMKNITIRLDEKEIETLKKLAIKDKRSLSAFIRLILQDRIKGK